MVCETMQDTDLLYPDCNLMKQSLKDEVKEALTRLTEKEAQIIRLYYGFDSDYPLTLEKIGEKFSLTGASIGEIKYKAIRHLRRFTISKSLRKYLG